MNKLSDLNGLSLDQLKQDLKEARTENNLLSSSLSEIEYQAYNLKLEKADLFQKYEEKASLAQNLKNQVDSLVQERDMLQSEYDTYKNQYEEAKVQNEMLQRQNRNLQDKIKRLNEIAVRFKQKTEQVEGALEYANLRQQKESGLLRDATNAKKKEIYGSLCCDA